MGPGPSEVDLWWIGRQTARGGAGWLSPDERERARRIVDPAVRADFVRHRRALRAVLAGYLDRAPHQVRFAYGPSGKPRLDGPGTADGPVFSLTHAGEWALIAVSGGGPLGVDLERLSERADMVGVARRFLPDLDLERIPAERRRTAFFRAWTRYEALVKAAGGALGRPLPAASREWAVRTLAAPPGYVATLVTGRPPAAVRCCPPAPTPAGP